MTGHRLDIGQSGVYKVIQLLGLLLTGILDFLVDAVFLSAPWSRRTTRVLVGILAILLVILAVASWGVLWWLIR